MWIDASSAGASGEFAIVHLDRNKRDLTYGPTPRMRPVGLSTLPWPIPDRTCDGRSVT